ncbi:MAG: 2-isopropylmalate synthase [Candidatus Bathyarchaeota archaeon]
MALSASFPKKIKIFDTTLRDGEQTPGVSLTPEKKLRIAKSLDKLGVNAIEAGFAAASEGELEAIRLIADAGLEADVYSMARGVIGDIDAVLKTGAVGVHLVIPSSDLHLEYKLKKTREEILEITADTTQYAKDHGLKVELSAEDATRSDLDFLARMLKAGVAAGADRLCPCDTVGVLIPERTSELYSELKKRLGKVPLSVHCHDDFGLAVANSIIALKSGADQAHVTINGLGERAGNASLEEIAVALKANYNVKLTIKTELLYETSRLVSRITEFPLQPNKAIVGENAFVHESGMHTHGILSNPATYEPFKPEMIGRTRRIASGKHSGSTGIRASLKEMGFDPSDKQVKEIFLRVKTLGDKGKRVADADLQAIAEAVMGLPVVRPIKLEEITVVTGSRVTSTASVRLNLNGKMLTEAATGVGPVDAAINAIKKAVGIVEPIQLENYSVKAITGGTNAVTEVAVSLSKGERKATAVGVNEDIVIASVQAMLSGMNVLMTNYNNKKGKEKS